MQPLLIICDALAWLLAVAAVGDPHIADIALLAAVMVLFLNAGLYRSRLSLSALDELPAIAGRTIIASALLLATALLVNETHVRAQTLGVAALMILLVVVFRASGYRLVRACRRSGLVKHPTLVLGAGRVGGQVAQHLLDHPSYGLHPVGFLDGDPLLAEHERPVPLLGGQDTLARTIADFQVKDVVVAFAASPESDIVDIIRTCERLAVTIFLVPRLYELHRTSTEMDEVRGLPLVRLSKAAFRRPSWRVKRALDVVLSGAALLLLAPLFAVIAIIVRVEGGPGVLFRQERVGLDARPFQLLKFRSMRPVDDHESQTQWNIAKDDRVGPFGRFIRSTSLDELPQLWNIMRGDMTVVGPRPERPHFASTFARTFPHYTARHRVPAGLTGWAQVHGLRGDTSIEDRARFDNYYIENWSLWLDVKIMWRTAGTVLRRAGG